MTGTSRMNRTGSYCNHYNRHSGQSAHRGMQDSSLQRLPSDGLQLVLCILPYGFSVDCGLRPDFRSARPAKAAPDRRAG
jgi:hypothetical protein